MRKALSIIIGALSAIWRALSVRFGPIKTALTLVLVALFALFTLSLERGPTEGEKNFASWVATLHQKKPVTVDAPFIVVCDIDVTREDATYRYRVGGDMQQTGKSVRLLELLAQAKKRSVVQIMPGEQMPSSSRHVRVVAYDGLSKFIIDFSNEDIASDITLKNFMKLGELFAQQRKEAERVG
jgi:hypothetical protein